MKASSTIKELADRIRELESEAEKRRRAEKERDRLERRLKERTLELESLSARLLNAQEEERKRIAGDLHDVIGQSLSAAKFMVETAIEQMVPPIAGSPALNSLKSLAPMLQKASEEVRAIVMNLRPSILDNLGILTTINWFCRQYEGIYTGIRIEKTIQIRERDVPEQLKTTIFRILQEAFNNIAKHSSAGEVRLGLDISGGRIELTVRDNGRGFETEAGVQADGAACGFGVTGMKERAELSGGAFQICSTRGEGTCIKASWPFGGSG